MKSILTSIVSLVLCFSLLAVAVAEEDQPAFTELAMQFEVNETDGDGEVVFSVKASEGLSSLQVLDPDGKVIVFLISNDKRAGIDPIGLAQFRLETAEPAIDGVKDAYPEGTYQFLARTINGDELVGEAILSHDRLPAPVFSPDGEEDVNPNKAVVKWKAVEGAVAYEVEIENDDLDVNVTARLPGSATRFKIPKGLLQPGTEYEVGVSTVTMDGNLSVADARLSRLIKPEK